MRIEIDGLDTAKGIEMTGGMQDLYIQVLSVFYKDSVRRGEEIKACIETGDLPLFTTHVHAIKSVSASVGAGNLSKAAEALEKAGLHKDMDFIKSNSAKFLEDLAKLLNNIHAFMLAEDSKKQDEPIDKERIKARLSKLKTAMEDYDTVAVNEAAKNLQAFTKVKGIGHAISKILEYKFMGEYDEAVELIDELLNS